MEYVKWCKYVLIILWSMITNNQVVNWFGSSYIVYGNCVKRIR